MKDNIKVIQDLSLLYELSLGTGKSLDLRENCAHFLDTLLRRKNLSYAAVWITEQSPSASGYQLIYATPGQQISETVTSVNHPILQLLSENSYIEVTDQESNFNSIVQEKNIISGFYVIYALGELGFLKLHSLQDYSKQKEELTQLVNVINRFALQLEACLSHQKLKEETEKRISVQEALFATEEKYRFMVQSLREGIIITDLEGRVTFANRQFEQISGYSQEELIGQKAFELLVDPQEQYKIRDGISRRKEGVSEEYVVQHVHKSGQCWQGRIKASPYRNKDGRIIGTLGAVTDVTQQIKAEQAIKESNERYSELFQNVYDALLILDQDSKIIECNRAAKRMLGFPNTPEIPERYVKDMIYPEDIEQSKLFFQKLIQDGYYRDYEGRIVTEGGEVKYVQVNSTAIFKDGQFAGSRDLVRDVSAQKKAEQKIIESEAKLRKIVDTSLDAVINIDDRGIIIEWNQNAEAIFGFSREEALQQEMANLIVPLKYRQAHRRGMKHYNHTGEGPVLNNRIEITAIDKQQREFPIELSITPIDLGDRKIFNGFIRDITDRKEAEKALIDAKQEAEQAQLAERQFLANMSHEIRTPMNAVIGMTHLLYETKPSDSQKEYLDALLFSADSLLSIINNILDLSKIEAGELEFEKRTFNLLELIKGLQRSFQFKVREKPVSVVMDIDPKINSLIIGDSTRLNQILTNLLGNASKFTQKGTIGVQVKLLMSQYKEHFIQFNVHDTGIGINTDQLHLIFDNFKQADLDTTRKFGGTGLGLTIVKQLVEMQKGTIRVSSEKNVGSTFSVILPFEDSGIKISEQALPQKPEYQIDELLQKIHLLVVEDNPMNQRLIKRVLELWDCPFTIANNGVQALEITQQQTFDIILMDIHMPEMDGVETTISIRTDPQNPNQQKPIIALTAAALLDEKNRALKAGMNDYLTKPFSPKQLKQTLQKWLQLESYPAPPATPNNEQQSVSLLKIDLAYLIEMGKSDPSFVPEMIAIFLSEIPNAIEQMTEAFQHKEWIQLRDIAHRITSNYMMMGMREQQQDALMIERMIKQNKFEEGEIARLVNQLRHDSKLAYSILEQKLADLN